MEKTKKIRVVRTIEISYDLIEPTDQDITDERIADINEIFMAIRFRNLLDRVVSTVRFEHVSE